MILKPSRDTGWDTFILPFDPSMWLVSFMAIFFGSVVACIPVALHTLLGIPMPSGERYTLPESIFDNFALLFQQGKAEGSLIQSPLLPSRATVQIFPGKKCRLCFSPFHSGTVFTHAETAIQQVGFLANN